VTETDGRLLSEVEMRRLIAEMGFDRPNERFGALTAAAGNAAVGPRAVSRVYGAGWTGLGPKSGIGPPSCGGGAAGLLEIASSSNGLLPNFALQL
jgi:hypothetical protein